MSALSTSLRDVQHRPQCAAFNAIIEDHDLFSDGRRTKESILRKPKKAILFDPVQRKTSVYTYDRTDLETVRVALGGGAVATQIRVQELVRWVVYSRGGLDCRPDRAGVAIRTVPVGVEQLFDGAILLVSKRGLHEYNADVDLLWPSFEFRWIGGGDVGLTFRLGQQYVGYRAR